MVHNAGRWVARRLGTFLIAVLLVEISSSIFRLDCGLVRLLTDQRTSAQSEQLFNLSTGLNVRLIRPSDEFRLEPGLARLAIGQRAPSKRSSSYVSELFRNNCARCHGADGRGDTPLGHTYKAPDFTDAEWWRTHSDITSNRSLIAIVTRGKGGMPAFAKKLKRTDIPLLVKYVRRFREQK